VSQRQVTVEAEIGTSKGACFGLFGAIPFLELPGGKDVDSGTEHQIVARAIEAGFG
jgi:hypothetical protein